MHLIGSWVGADVGVMVVFAVSLVVVTAIGAYVVRGALARRQQTDLSAPGPEEVQQPQQNAKRLADRKTLAKQRRYGRPIHEPD